MNIVSDYTVTNTTALLRCDLNVPIDGAEILDKTKLEASIQTIKYLILNHAKVVITSHFGRPDGERNVKYSLKPIHKELEKMLDTKITFIEEIKSEDSVKIVKNGKSGEVFMLENLRFYKEEEEGSDHFAQILANYGTIYVNDAFACSHRKHASLYGITKYLPSFAGLNLANEVKKIDETLDQSKKTFCIIGGSKISSKIKLVENMMKTCSSIFIAGGMANTFFAAMDLEIGFSLCEKDQIENAKDILEKAKKSGCKLILPIDVMTSKSFKIPLNCKVLDASKVEKDDYILDCGIQTLKLLDDEIKSSENVIWNGPLGLNEVRPFNVGSESLARSIAYFTRIGKVKSIVGGGDAVFCAKMSGVADEFSFVSTGGGAFLEYLENGSLIAIEPLKQKIEM